MKKNQNHLAAWFTHPDARHFFGKAFEARAAALALVLRGHAHGHIAAEARRLGISRQAMQKHVARAATYVSATKS